MNRLLAILINIITQKNIDLKSIGNINNIWGILIKLGGTYTRKIVEINLERQIINFYLKIKVLIWKYQICIYSIFMCNFIKPTLVAFSKLIQPNAFNIFLRILENFKEPKIEIRITIGEIVVQFIYMLDNRDKNMKSNHSSYLK